MPQALYTSHTFEHPAFILSWSLSQL